MCTNDVYEGGKGGGGYERRQEVWNVNERADVLCGDNAVPTTSTATHKSKDPSGKTPCNS